MTPNRDLSCLIMKRLATAIAGLALVLSSTSVQAQEPEPDASARQRARAHFRAGQQLVEDAHYDQAYAEFRAGYELSHRPLFLFNMAECARSSGQLSRAKELYERYVQEDPEGPMAATARTSAAEVEASLATEPSSTPRAEPAADDRPLPDDAAAATIPTPRQAAEASVPADLASAGPSGDGPGSGAQARPWWEDWPFWTVVGGLILAGVVTAAIVATQVGGSSCGGSCQLVDFTQMTH